jgi:hypothetical protein
MDSDSRAVAASGVFTWIRVFFVILCFLGRSAWGQPPTSIYRAYTDSEARPYAESVAKLEKQLHVVPAPPSLVMPQFVVLPKTFDLDLRRGRTLLEVVAFIVLDAKGKLIGLYIIGASDLAVAKSAGANIAKAKWIPARVDGVAVASASIFASKGAGIPN